MAQLREETLTDWTNCALVEVNPHKASGVPILRGTHVQADSIVENVEGGSPIEKIADNFDIPESTIRAVLACSSENRKSIQD